jgi:hypothetical protein
VKNFLEKERMSILGNWIKVEMENRLFASCKEEKNRVEKKKILASKVIHGI